LNGAVDYANDTTHLGSEITYSCTKNYRLNGFLRRYCLDNGQWKIWYRDPEKIGVYRKTQVSTDSVGDVAHYSCSCGFYMEGNETRIYLQNGSWSGTTPLLVFI
ncbi:SVEP1 protein, partial [Acromyrmex charruanus]